MIDNQKNQYPWFFQPIVLLWEFLASILKLTGRMVGAIIGLVLMIIGIILTVTIVAAPVGIPLLIIVFYWLCGASFSYAYQGLEFPTDSIRQPTDGISRTIFLHCKNNSNWIYINKSTLKTFAGILYSKSYITNPNHNNSFPSRFLNGILASKAKSVWYPP